MRVTDTAFNPSDRYSLGHVTETGQPCLSIPVSTGVVDYEEHYALTLDQYDRFLADTDAAAAFAAECRRREHDELLLQRPGWNRGTPV